jgi:hypothetical protein
VKYINLQYERLPKNGNRVKYAIEGKEYTVEEAAAYYYMKNGYSVIFSENTYWNYLIALLFWDVIFAKVPEAVASYVKDEWIDEHSPEFKKAFRFVELNGIQEKEDRGFYTLKRPLLGYRKSELKEYLDKKNIKYFIDESNFDLKYKRNHIRASYSDKFLEEFSVGVKQSFEYLQIDIDSLFSNITTYSKEQLIIFSNCADDNVSIRLIDRELKRRNLLISSALRVEILAQREIIVSDKIAISITSSQIWIAPKCDKVMDKEFKEKCRTNKIPKNMRSYISTIDYFL